MHSKHRIGHSLIMLGMFSWLALTVAVSVFPSRASAISSSDIFSLSNSQRTSNGLAPYISNSKLNASAQAKAQHMLANGYFAHDAPDGTTPWSFIAGQGYSYSTAGENLASSNQGASAVVNGWMNSPGHRANVLNNSFTEVGYGVVYVGNWEYQGTTYPDTYFVVAHYALPTNAPEPEPEPEPVVAQQSSSEGGTPTSTEVAEETTEEPVETVEEPTEEPLEEEPRILRVETNAGGVPIASVAPQDSRISPTLAIIIASGAGLAVVSGVILEIRWIRTHGHIQHLHMPHIGGPK